MKILSVTNQEKNICYNNKRKTDSINVNYKSSVCIKPWGYEFLIYEETNIFQRLLKKEDLVSCI